MGLVNSPKIFILGLTLLVTCCLTVSGEIFFKDGAPHVKLSEESEIVGVVNISRNGRPYVSFIGLPYGKIPERFSPPELIRNQAWTGVKNFIAPGPKCYPALNFTEDSPVTPEVSEDCLNLNVYIPLSSSVEELDSLPILFWIHDGLTSGAEYSPVFFMDEDVILVTINYRIGALGFLSSGDHVIPGNNGLKDMVVALKWVQENIENFGGDARQVTIFGQGFGGISVHYLLLSPQTAGLFSRAISQSGTVFSPWDFSHDPRKFAVQLASQFGCPTTAKSPEEISSEEILVCLRKVPAYDLDMAQYGLWPISWILELPCPAFLPVVEPAQSPSSNDPPIISESPITILQDKSKPFKNIPWMVGTTEFEGAGLFAGVIFNNETAVAELAAKWDQIAPNIFRYEDILSKEDQRAVSDKLKKFYFDDQPVSLENTNRRQLTNLFSDVATGYGVWKTALETAARGANNPVYLYEYAYPGPVSITGTWFELAEEEAKLVSYGDETQHQFPYQEAIKARDGNKMVNPADKAFSQNFVKLWTSFATHGKPKHTWGDQADQKWTPISMEEIEGTKPLKWYKIDSNPEFTEKKLQDRMELWDNLWEEYYIPAYLKSKI